MDSIKVRTVKYIVGKKLNLDLNKTSRKFEYVKARMMCYKILREQCNFSLADITTKRIKELEAEGYYVIKLIKTNKNGIPDLLAIPPNCEVLFSEIKKDNGKVSRLQEYRLKELEKHGCKTEVYNGVI